MIFFMLNSKQQFLNPKQSQNSNFLKLKCKKKTKKNFFRQIPPYISKTNTKTNKKIFIKNIFYNITDFKIAFFFY